MHRMIDMQADDTVLLDHLRELERLVTGAGGMLHPDLRIIVNDGEISVASTAPNGAPLVRLPKPCLVPIDDVQFGLDGDEIQIESCPVELGEAQRAILDCMLAIYNRADKIRHHRAAMPWLAFADRPELLDYLHMARKDAPKPTKLYELARSGAGKELVLDSFIGTRALNLAFADQATRQVVMPFVDFFNHHAMSPPFSRDGEALIVARSSSRQGSNECFVRYNLLDAMDAYLNYGFVDRSAPFLRSVPMRITLPGIGAITVKGRVARARKQALSPGLQKLGVYLPRFQRLSENELSAAQLLIPTTNVHQILGGVLSVLIGQLAPGLSHDELLSALEQGTDQVLRVNERYYTGLQTLAGTVDGDVTMSPAFEQLNALAAFQLNMLATQRNLLSINPDAMSGMIIHGEPDRG